MNEPKSVSDAIKLTNEISRGILRTRRHRRMVMATFLVVAALFCLLGVTLLGAALEKNVVLFLAYWAVCLVVVEVALLFALYDVLMVRKEFSEEMSSLKKEYRDVLDAVEESEKEQG